MKSHIRLPFELWMHNWSLFSWKRNGDKKYIDLTGYCGTQKHNVLGTLGMPTFTIILFIFVFKHLNWSIIALQWCVSFCFIPKWISYTYTYVPISLPSCISLPPTLPIPPLSVVTKHRADLPVLCGCFPLAIGFTFGSVYMSMPLSHIVTAYPSPSPYPQVHSLVGLCLYSHLATRFFMAFFFPLDSINMR